MSEGKIESNGIQIWYEDFGDKKHPAVLLIMGAGGQAIAWPMELINPLVEAGHHVVRFDNRDVGLSTWIDDFQANAYTLDDMAGDAIALMDALRIDRAHVIGVSMGGMIAQLLAIHHPDRVLSLTSWMSTYSMSDPDVPAMAPEVQDLVAKSMTSPPQTGEEMLESSMAMSRLLSGSRFPFNEEAFLAAAEVSSARGQNPKNNHGPAALSAPSRLDALRNLDVPTLIIHGDEDPIINHFHGVVCAKVIPGARLHTQKGVGHEIPLGILPETLPVLLDHIGGTT